MAYLDIGIRAFASAHALEEVVLVLLISLAAVVRPDENALRIERLPSIPMPPHIHEAARAKQFDARSVEGPVRETIVVARRSPKK